MNFLKKSKWILPVFVLIQLMSCSKDHDAPVQTGSPSISFASASGEYKVKISKTLVITPTVKDAVKPVYSWKLDGKIIATSLNCSFSNDEAGEYFLTFRVDAQNGSTEQQVKVSVMAKLPPEINMSANMVAYTGIASKIVAKALYTDSATTYTWRLNGSVVSTDSSYTFNQANTGTQQLSLKVTTADGEDLKVFSITVLPPPVSELFFDDGHYHIPGDQTARRLSVPIGKSLVLAPVIMHVADANTFTWTVDGVAQNENTQWFTFTPKAKGTYVITVATVGANAVSTKVNVECVDAEGTFIRETNASSRTGATKAFEFVPAPGQFTNFQIGSTAARATASIQTALDGGSDQYIASLGAYGGYIITGFDHSVKDVAGKADIKINGNAFQGWSEPGIVWVMQDENGNGLPDDTWYELKGSESGKPETKQRYALTYFKPSTTKSDVLWLDNYGNSGSVDYNSYHTQNYYFPMFIPGNSYTLTGTCLKATFLTGAIDYSPGYPWGYVDNYGDGSKLDFWLEDAIQADGTPANLKYIDFVKVHTGIIGKGVAVGEVSTESGAPFDLNLK